VPPGPGDRTLGVEEGAAGSDGATPRLVHVVSCTWKAGTSGDQVERYASGLGDVRDRLGLTSLHFGPDAGLTEGAADFAVVGTLPDVASWCRYMSDNGHRAARLPGGHADPRVPDIDPVPATPHGAVGLPRATRATLGVSPVLTGSVGLEAVVLLTRARLTSEARTASDDGPPERRGPDRTGGTPRATCRIPRGRRPDRTPSGHRPADTAARS
jgi:hypothetical protein